MCVYARTRAYVCVCVVCVVLILDYPFATVSCEWKKSTKKNVCSSRDQSSDSWFLESMQWILMGKLYRNNMARRIVGTILSSFPQLYIIPRGERKKPKYMSLFFSVNKKPYRKPVCRLIPANQRINHSPPYLLGFTQLKSNNHNHIGRRYVN